MAMAVEKHPSRSYVGIALPLAIGVAFSCFYLAVIAWSPGTSVRGSVGPFANPSIIPPVVLVAALTLALRRHYRAAQVIAIAGAAIELLIAALAAPAGWPGPSAPTAVSIAGLGVIAAVPWLSRKTALTAAGVLLALVLVLVVVETLALAYLQPYVPIAPALPLLSAAVVMLVLLTGAWSVRRAHRAASNR